MFAPIRDVISKAALFTDHTQTLTTQVVVASDHNCMRLAELKDLETSDSRVSR